MKKIFKKNQIIITALAVMIAVAGYINYSDSKLTKDTVSSDNSTDTQETVDINNVVEDIESLDYDLNDEIAEAADSQDGAQASPEAEAETGNEADTESTEENPDAAAEESAALDAAAETPGEAVLTNGSTYVAQAKLSREQIRSQNKETLLEVINNPELSEAERQSAVESMVTMTDAIEKEAATETLLEAKGFQNIVVSITGEGADVMVPSSELDDSQRAQIEDAVKRKAGIEPKNIVITPMNETQE